MNTYRGWAACAAKAPLELLSFEMDAIGPDDVEIAVDYCGICHSDLSVRDNDWGVSSYPVVLGHEAVGRVVALGANAKGLKVGQLVGIGWTAESCMHCHQCLSGNQHLCDSSVATIIGHRGGFAERLRAHWDWVIPLPEGLDPATAGPLLCGGVTVFSPFLTFDVRPTQHVGIVGIGGLGHMALKFAHAWGCEVTAFTSSDSKADEARAFGAHKVVNSRDSQAIGGIAGSLDLLLVTVNVPLDWAAMIAALRPQGRMHVVGAVLEPIPVAAFSLISGQKSVSGSPTGSPTTIAAMLEFAARHKIAPQVERFPMSEVNAALAHLAAGKARYRIVLEADF